MFVINEKKIYQSCIRSAMLYGSETWCLRENETAISRRTEKTMMIAMRGVKIIEVTSQGEWSAM